MALERREPWLKTSLWHLPMALQAPGAGTVQPHVDGYRRLLEAIRDDRYDFDAAEKLDVVGYENLPIKAKD